MSAFKRLFFVFAILFAFLLGISAADKECLSSSVVGICILTENPDLSAQLWEFIEQTNFADISDLYQHVKDRDFDATVSCSKRFFNADALDMGHFPDGVYDTIIIDLGGNNSSEMVYLKQLKPMARRFKETNDPVAASVQKYYISFLSLIGKTEKLALDFTGNF